jgi:hypothetical protein
MPIASNDDDAIVVERLSTVSGQCRTSFGSRRNLTFLNDDGIVGLFSGLPEPPESRETRVYLTRSTWSQDDLALRDAGLPRLLLQSGQSARGRGEL